MLSNTPPQALAQSGGIIHFKTHAMKLLTPQEIISQLEPLNGAEVARELGLSRQQVNSYKKGKHMSAPVVAMFSLYFETYRGNTHTGWQVGNVKIHGHTHNPENWELSCKQLGISRLQLCSKTCKEWEVIDIANAKLRKQKEVVLNAYEKAIDLLENAIMSLDK